MAEALENMDKEFYKFVESILLSTKLDINDKRSELEDSSYGRDSFYRYIVNNMSEIVDDKNPNNKVYHIKVNGDTREIRPGNTNRLSRKDYIDMILGKDISINISNIDIETCRFLELFTKCDNMGLIDFSTPNAIFKKDMEVLLENDTSTPTLDFMRSKSYTISNLTQLCRFIEVRLKKIRI